MTQLSKRERLFTEKQCREYPMRRGFHKPQRPHVKQPMPERRPEDREAA